MGKTTGVMKLHAEFIRICAPIKRQIQALDVRPRLDFCTLLVDLIGELKRKGYKLVSVSKHYRVNERWQVDSFWRRGIIQNNTDVNFVCKLSISLKGDFRINLDFDFWLEFPVIRESISARLHGFLFPQSLGRISAEAMKVETARAWEKVNSAIQAELPRLYPEGWGKHGLDERIEHREARRVCHVKELALTRSGEFSKFLTSLQEVDERALKLVKGSMEVAIKISEETFDGFVSFPLETEIEELLAWVVLKYGDGFFEYQVRRFVHDNFAVSSQEIAEALRRFELWGYLTKYQPPSAIRRELEMLGIRKFQDFYIHGPREVPKRRLPGRRRVRGGVRPEPLPLTIIPNFLRAPNHLVNRAIMWMLQRKILRRRSTTNCLGRHIVECKVVRRPRRLTKLEMEIIKTIAWHRRKQLELLNRMKDYLRKLGLKNAFMFKEKKDWGENAEDTHNL
jgi:hypothetical protein